MQLGLIARADNTGLGIQTHEAYRHLRPAKTMVVEMSGGKGLKFHRDRYSGPGVMFTGPVPTDQEIMRFLDGLDVVYVAETPYSTRFYPLARQRKVATVEHTNYEFYDHHPDRQPTLRALPTTWYQDKVPHPKIVLPVPVARRWVEPTLPTSCRRFLHPVGYPAICDRNGTQDVINALRHVKSNIEVTFRSQKPVVTSFSGVPPTVRTIVEVGDVPDYWKLYEDIDAVILPRRFGGLCLPAQEAVAAGLPVIMTAIEPNFWLPQEWLTPASHFSDVMARQRVDVHRSDMQSLAWLIDRFATDDELYARAKQDAKRLAAELSWDALKPQYDKVFEAACAMV